MAAEEEVAAEPAADDDPFADLIGGERNGARSAEPMDLGDPFADDGDDLVPAPSTTVVMPAADDDSDLFDTGSAGAESEPTTTPRMVTAESALPGRDELRTMLEKMAWEAFGDVTDRIVRETVQRVEQIAWEVIPKMAETLIREEIRRLKESDEQ
jgi:hypothetical protein